ncbi:MAG: hypothetical protein JO273_05325 [Methylobacteriaceae bacterium]|nr:hypothetical protein [Methylobacteriaceae bacterium]
MSKRSIFLAAAALLPFLAPAPASAGSYYAQYPAYGEETVCQPLCARDYAPCDPPYFKNADQRCQIFRHGGRHNR